MALSKRMMAVGIPAQQALSTNGQTITNGVATGSTQLTAAPVTSDNNLFTTVPASSGCILPSDAVPGDNVYVFNFQGTNALLVYPPVGGTLHNLAINTGLSLAANKAAFFQCYGPLLWFYILSN